MARYALPREPGGVASNMSRESDNAMFVDFTARELFVMTFPARIPTVMTMSKIAASANLMDRGTTQGIFSFLNAAVRAITRAANP